jgi:hypothetical protein
MLALWALALAAYSNSFQAGLVFDSAAVISEDARVHAVTPQNLRLTLTGPYSPYPHFLIIDVPKPAPCCTHTSSDGIDGRIAGGH